MLDTVGNCSVIDSKPSAGLKIVGEKGGYESKESANQAMKNEVKCKGVGTNLKSWWRDMEKIWHDESALAV